MVPSFWSEPVSSPITTLDNSTLPSQSSKGKTKAKTTQHSQISVPNFVGKREETVTLFQLKAILIYKLEGEGERWLTGFISIILLLQCLVDKF